MLQRHDMQGVILPPVYEIFPNYFFDTKIVQKVQDFILRYGYDKVEHEPVHHVYVNYTSYLPFGENQIAYFTEDIGLNAYYSYVMLASYVIPYVSFSIKIRMSINRSYLFYSMEFLSIGLALRR